MFYDRFVQLCNEKNITPSRAAIDAGLSKSTVTKWKNAPDSEPSGSAIKKLSEYFGISKAELLGEEMVSPEKKSPAPEKPITGENIIAMVEFEKKLYDAIVKMGLIPVGAQLTKQQSDIVVGILRILTATFGTSEDEVKHIG